MAQGTPATQIPDSPQSADLQAVRRAARTYGSLDKDPSSPIDGYTWIRKDLSPPELRTKLNGTLYKLVFTAA